MAISPVKVIPGSSSVADAPREVRQGSTAPSDQEGLDELQGLPSMANVETHRLVLPPSTRPVQPLKSSIKPGGF